MNHFSQQLNMSHISQCKPLVVSVRQFGHPRTARRMLHESKQRALSQALLSTTGKHETQRTVPNEAQRHGTETDSFRSASDSMSAASTASR